MKSMKKKVFKVDDWCRWINQWDLMKINEISWNFMKINVIFMKINEISWKSMTFHEQKSLIFHWFYIDFHEISLIFSSVFKLIFMKFHTFFSLKIMLWLCSKFPYTFFLVSTKDYVKLVKIWWAAALKNNFFVRQMCITKKCGIENQKKKCG